jgi:ABC-type nickel/cobalt efflux system permease component RcnA
VRGGGWVVDAQRRVRETIADIVGEATAGSGTPVLLYLLAFGYGFLHALGPGHRKIALGAYFVSQPSKTITGVGAGLGVAGLHGLSAIAVVYGIYYVLRASFLSSFTTVTSIVEAASYAAVFILGTVLLVSAVMHWRRHATHRHDETENGDAPNRSLGLIVLSSGMVPCPGAATIMVLCISVGLPLAGVFSGLALSAGMAIVTVSVSLAAILGKQGVLRLASRQTARFQGIHHVVEVAGATVLTAFGLFMVYPYVLAYLG